MHVKCNCTYKLINVYDRKTLKLIGQECVDCGERKSCKK